MKSLIGHRCLLALLLFSLLLSLQGRSQNASLPLVVVEQMQAYSYLNPTASYWKIPANINPILESLDSSLFVSLKMQRDKSYTTTIRTLTKLTQAGKIKIDWSNSSQIPYHAYLEIYEMGPEFAFQNDLVQLSKGKKDSLHSVWFIACSIFNLKQERVFQKTIMLGFTTVESLGLGYTIKSTPSIPSLLYNAIAKSMNYLDTEGNEIDFIDVKVPAAYATDNYWMPFVHNMPRILFDTTKQFISFIDKAGVHALRMPPAVLKKINNKDKSENNPYKDIIELIKKTRPVFSKNEYYQVMQPLRDIKNNIDYTLESYIEFNSEPVFDDNKPKFAIQFLSEATHRIFQDKDSIGYFSVKDFVKEDNKFYFPDNVYNGYDSTHTANLGTLFAKQPIILSRVISGNTMHHDFVIQLNYENNITTILINKQIVMVISGNKKPIQMVEKRADLPTLENLLLLMAYAEIFQQPG
jgi:hypothetical protein